MKRILALSGSSSSKSINKQLLTHVASLADGEVELISVLDIPAPIFSVDLEDEHFPESIRTLAAKLDAADGVLIATPEHNGHMPAMFKNVIDWLSRTGRRPFLTGAPVLLMGTSPGGRGGGSVLGHLSMTMPFWGVTLVGTFSLPSFNKTFSDGAVTDAGKAAELAGLMESFNAATTPSE